MEVTRLSPRRAIDGDRVPEGHAQSPQAGHPECADREIVMIRIDLHLNGRVQLDAVLLLVDRDGLLSFGFDVRPQEFRFLLVQSENRRGRFEREEILIAVEQPHRIIGEMIAKLIVVADLKLFAGLDIAPQPHQIDRQLRAGAV